MKVGGCGGRRRRQETQACVCQTMLVAHTLAVNAHRHHKLAHTTPSLYYFSFSPGLLSWGCRRGDRCTACSEPVKQPSLQHLLWPPWTCTCVVVLAVLGARVWRRGNVSTGAHSHASAADVELPVAVSLLLMLMCSYVLVTEATSTHAHAAQTANARRAVTQRWSRGVCGQRLACHSTTQLLPTLLL